jgi:hypothetical protein
MDKVKKKTNETKEKEPSDAKDEIKS